MPFHSRTRYQFSVQSRTDHARSNQMANQMQSRAAFPLSRLPKITSQGRLRPLSTPKLCTEPARSKTNHSPENKRHGDGSHYRQSEKRRGKVCYMYTNRALKNLVCKRNDLRHPLSLNICRQGPPYEMPAPYVCTTSARVCVASRSTTIEGPDLGHQRR